MKKGRKNLLGIGVLVFALWLAFPGHSWTQTIQPTQPGMKGRAPVITQAYAPERGYYGDVLRIYLEADDPDQNMLRIATVVEQMGYGHYPPDWIYLKPQYRGHFVGYLQWNTASVKGSYIPDWTQITIKVSVFDRAGHESNVVVIPFEFTSGVGHYPLPPPFHQPNIPRLGHIDINLSNPYQNDASDFRN
jgi:hypothetical protein